MVLGEDGIIAQAKLAAERTREEEEKAQADFNKLAGDIQNLVNGGTTTGGGTITLDEAKKKTEPFTETTEVTVVDGTMTVPAGFKILEGDSIDTGIVVQDRAKNEFVWVPVEEPSTIYGTDKDGNKLGKLYNFTKGTDGKTVVSPLNWTETQDESGKKVMRWTTTSDNTSYRESDTVNNDTSNFSSVQENDYKDFKEQLQSEFNSMIASVEKYGGFYIGRYETSSLDTTTPIVQSGKTPTINIDWYKMYKNSKEIAKGTGATSRMIWGCQWDAVMNWMKDIENTTVPGEETKYYVTDSKGMGWYSNNSSSKVHNTGEPVDSNKNEVNKIWDMAGNVWEWTMEAYNTIDRVGRGGYCETSGADYPASFRIYDIGYYLVPSYSNYNVGSRVTLYVNL